MVSYKNSALKDILKSRGVRGYSTKNKDALLTMVMESGGLIFPKQDEKKIEVPQITDIKEPKKEETKEPKEPKEKKTPKKLKVKTDVKK